MILAVVSRMSDKYNVQEFRCFLTPLNPDKRGRNRLVNWPDLYVVYFMQDINLLIYLSQSQALALTRNCKPPSPPNLGPSREPSEHRSTPPQPQPTPPLDNTLSSPSLKEEADAAIKTPGKTNYLWIIKTRTAVLDQTKCN